MSSELHYSELERRINVLESRIDSLDRRNSELRESVTALRHELESVKTLVQLQDIKADAILNQVSGISKLQGSLEKHISFLFDGLETHLKAIQASVEAGGKAVPFGK